MLLYTGCVVEQVALCVCSDITCPNGDASAAGCEGMVRICDNGRDCPACHHSHCNRLV